MDKKIEKSKTRGLLTFSACTLVLVGACWLIFQSNTSSSATAKHDRINTSTVRFALFEDYLPLRAYVEPYKTVYLDAVEGGRVEKRFVEEGQIVEKGQRLILLSNTSLQLDIIAREAQVSEQINNLRNTKLAIEQNRLRLKSDLIELDYRIKRIELQLKRRKKISHYIGAEELEEFVDELDYLRKKRAVTKESQEQDEQLRKLQIEQLEDNVIQLEKNLKIARSNLDNLLVTAPRSGRLTSFDIELGETLSRGERLGQIDDIDRYKVSGKVSEYYLSAMKLGQKAELLLNDEHYTLELIKIYPNIQNNEFEVDLIFSEKIPKHIRRGQTLNPRLLLSKKEKVLLVDNGSFMRESIGQWAYVLESNKKSAHRREINIGRKNPNFIEIISGLKKGEKIITSSYSNYRNSSTAFSDTTLSDTSFPDTIFIEE